MSGDGVIGTSILTGNLRIKCRPIGRECKNGQGNISGVNWGGYRITDNKEFFSSSAVNSRTRRTGRLYMRDVACVLGISWFGWSVQNSGLAEAGYWLLRAAAVYLYGVRNQSEAGGPAKRKT